MDVEAMYDKSVGNVADMYKQGQCTKEEYIAYKEHMDELAGKIKRPIERDLVFNMQEVRENAMVTPTELARLVEIGLYRFNRYDQMFRGFKPGEKYVEGDSYETHATFEGFYGMWEKEGTAMAFVKDDYLKKIKLSINDPNTLILHTTDIPKIRGSAEAKQALLYGGKLCLFESDESIKYGSNKPDDMVIPFRLSVTGHADAYHKGGFYDKLAMNIFKHLGIEPVRLGSKNSIQDTDMLP